MLSSDPRLYVFVMLSSKIFLLGGFICFSINSPVEIVSFSGKKLDFENNSTQLVCEIYKRVLNDV